jgi:hypothetical protein
MATLAFFDILYSDSETRLNDMFFVSMTDMVSSKAAHPGIKQIADRVRQIKAAISFTKLISFTFGIIVVLNG